MGCLALVASFGATRSINQFGAWGKAMITVTLLEAAASIWLIMMPVPLSYFSPVCGGLPGVVLLGMEPAYDLGCAYR